MLIFSELFFLSVLQQLLVSHVTAVAGMSPGSSYNQVEQPCVAMAAIDRIPLRHLFRDVIR